MQVYVHISFISEMYLAECRSESAQKVLAVSAFWRRGSTGVRRASRSAKTNNKCKGPTLKMIFSLFTLSQRVFTKSTVFYIKTEIYVIISLVSVQSSINVVGENIYN